MQLSHVKTINQYNTLLINLNTLGKYQLRIFAICVAYWMLAGLLKTVFQLGFSNIKCPYALGLFQALGLLIFSSLSSLKGRKVGTIASGICSCVGFLFTLFAILSQTFQVFSSIPNTLGTVGIAIVGLSIYSQPFLLLCIVCQLTTLRAIQIIFSICIGMFSIGKIVAVCLHNFIQNNFTTKDKDLWVAVYILAPSCLLSLLLGIFVNDSPRFFIENNIHRAEDLIKKIVHINGGQQNQVLGHIDQNFMLKRIHLRKYNYLTLFKFNSLGFSQYCTIIVFLLLGIISRQANFIFQLKTTMVPIQIQIIWISGFQIIGIIASAFFLTFCKRRMTCIFTSLFIAIVSTILFFIYDRDMAKDLVFLGLNAVFSIILFAFLVINAIQFYPHSIRTLGIGVMLGAYYFGQLLFYIYLLTNPEPKVVLQLFLWGSWIMFGHCCGQKETLKLGLAYQIKQIQQQENEEI